MKKNSEFRIQERSRRRSAAWRQNQDHEIGDLVGDLNQFIQRLTERSRWLDQVLWMEGKANFSRDRDYLLFK
ncbi:MAG: hypothetical protein V7L05_32560 [Nostoc sp.]|uniref:hypothetical protein n=1 Tax=Nostoc sp. TaxID=1180 RepID=UPI002FFA149E